MIGWLSYAVDIGVKNDIAAAILQCLHFILTPRSLLGIVENLIFDMHSEMVHSFSLVKVSLKITSEDQFEFSMN